MRLVRETGHNPVREEQFLLPGLGQQTCSFPLDPELRITHWMSASLLPYVKILSPADTLQALPMPGKSAKSELPAELTGSGSSQLAWRTAV